MNIAMTEAGRREGERQIKLKGRIYSYAAIYTAMEAARGDCGAEFGYADIVASDAGMAEQVVQ
jgi:hypothetical protein